MSPENAMHAEWECVKVLTYFFNSLDDRRFADLAACMTETGVWVRQGKPLEGRSAILSALAERSSTVSTRHLISNPGRGSDSPIKGGLHQHPILRRRNRGVFLYPGPRLLDDKGSLPGVDAQSQVHIAFASATEPANRLARLEPIPIVQIGIDLLVPIDAQEHIRY